MCTPLTSGLRFETQRMTVTGWHDVAARQGAELAPLVAGLLTPTTTRALPSDWRGEYSIARAQQWVTDRDGESPTLLVIDRRTDEVIGLVILFETAAKDGLGVDLRIGYLLSETVWGQGLATELLAGLVAWARLKPGIATLTGGVEATNLASVRVLSKNGFAQIAAPSDVELIYRLKVDLADP